MLLLAWAAVSFGACYFVRDLTWRLGDWPLGYWIASQGAVLAFIAIVVAYCVAMDRFERADARAATDMQRPAQPEELSPAYVFLAAPSCASYITGIVLPVTGSVGAI